MNILLYFITILHIIVIMFVLLSPFSNSNYLLLLHVVFVPFIMFHWYINDNTCCLTLAEKMIMEKTTGKEVDISECITYKLIAPIYDFNKNHKDFETFTYALTTFLWMISSYNLYSKYNNGEIKTFKQLMTI